MVKSTQSPCERAVEVPAQTIAFNAPASDWVRFARRRYWPGGSGRLTVKLHKLSQLRWSGTDEPLWARATLKQQLNRWLDDQKYARTEFVCWLRSD